MGTTYKIQKGDNLSSIAKKYGTTVGALQSANNISNPNLIIAGNTLNIPNLSDTSTITDVGTSTNTDGDTSTNTDVGSAGIESNTISPSAETNTALTNKNTYDSAVASYSDFTFTGKDKLDAYMSQWEKRPDFNYDFNADALYQQYKDKYIQQGKMAMQDAIGQASAMTGGYGNSYAATVGNQAYQSHLQQLNDVIPELYQIAYDKYNQEGQDLLNSISMLRGEREYEYGVDQDKYNKLLNQQSYWGDQYLDWYDRGYETKRDSVADSQWEKNYGLAEDQLRISERELEMAEEAWNLEKQAFNSDLGGISSSGSGSSGSGSSGNTTTASGGVPSNITKAVQNYTTKEGQAEYLAKQVSAGKITQDQAYALLDSYGVTPMNERSWEMVDSGGVNWFGGIDNNAVVRDETGKEYKLSDLKKELEKTMSSSEAKKYIKDLQKQLGI